MHKPVQSFLLNLSVHNISSLALYPFISLWTLRSLLKDLPLIVYELVDGHKPLHPPRLFNDIAFDAIKLDNFAKHHRNAAVTAEASLELESDEQFRQHGLSIPQSEFILRNVMYVKKKHAIYLWAQIIENHTFEQQSRTATKILYFLIIFFYITH